MAHAPHGPGGQLPRWIFLRLLALAHLAAFLSFWVQAHGLVGTQGILPAAERFAAFSAAQPPQGWLDHPSFGWLGAGDLALSLHCGVGVALAVALALGLAPRLVLFALWLVTLSTVHLGAPFLNYQWDVLLVEATLLAIPYAPGGLRPRLRTAAAPDAWAVWLPRLLLFKLVWSSGVVKLTGGDPTWHDLGALAVHYETQPLPHGLAWWAHQLPEGFQRFSTAATLALELFAPLLILLRPSGWRLAVWALAAVGATVAVGGAPTLGAFIGVAALGLLLDDRVLGRLPFRHLHVPPAARHGRQARALAAALIAGLMLLISATGNYGFFQLLTVALCLPLLDDGLLWRLTPARWIDRWPPLPTASTRPSRVLGVAGVAVWAPLSALVMLGLAGGGTFRAARQARAADEASLLQRGLLAAVEAGQTVIAPVRPFYSVNTYGLFAHMTTTRDELTVEGSLDGQTWQAYRFRYKPNEIGDPLPLVGLHLPRLDWQMWFAALSPSCRQSGWFLAFVRALLRGAQDAQGLLAHDPFEGKAPLQIRVLHHRWRFTDRATRAATGAPWAADPPVLWCPPLTLESFEPPRVGGPGRRRNVR